MNSFKFKFFGIVLVVCIVVIVLFGIRNSERKKTSDAQSTAIAAGKNAAMAAPAPRNPTAPVLDAIAPASRPHAFPSSALWRMAARPITSALASVSGQAVAAVVVADLDVRGTEATFSEIKAGDTIAIAMPDGKTAQGKINLVLNDAGTLRLGGELTDRRNGTFSLTMTGDKELYGRILLPDEKIAYIIKPGGARDAAVVEAEALGDVICDPFLRERDDKAPAQADAAETAAVGAAPAEATSQVPLLNSRPGATAVLYLCFDGAIVTDPDWNSGKTIDAAACALSSSSITLVWKRVSENYSPFNINVTTDVSKYNNAPVSKRARCIITPTSSWYNTNGKDAGGVSYTGSFAQAGRLFSSTVPCWVFNTSVTGIADAVAHELGHTVGLSHDGLSNPASEYYDGQGTAPMSWGPIMGAPYDQKIVQWSRGEYANANNHEDDVAIISGSVNGFGYITTAPGNSIATATYMSGGMMFSQTGVIRASNDVHYYKFTLQAAVTVDIQATPADQSPMLDIDMELRDAAGNLVDHDNPSLAMNADIARHLDAGDYYIKICGSGYGDPATNGYSTYSSIGQYTLWSNTTSTIAAPVITQSPIGANIRMFAGSLSLWVLASGPGTFRYQWIKDGTNINTSDRISTTTDYMMTITNPQLADSGSYRVIVRSAGGDVLSNVALVSVTLPPAPVITGLSPAGVLPGGTMTITGNYFTGATQVYFNNSSAAKFTVDSDTQITVTAPASFDATGNIIVVTPGGTVTSAVGYFLASVPSLLGALVSTQPVAQGHNITFRASAFATPTPSYSWQISSDGGLTWNNINDGGMYNGASTNTLAVSGITSSFNNARLRYIASNAYGSGTSSASIVNVFASVFTGPAAIARNSSGTLYVSDTSSQTIKTTGGIFAGSDGVAGAIDGPLASARFNQPCALAMTNASELIIADAGNGAVRKIIMTGSSTSWTVSTVATGFMNPSGVAATTAGTANKVYVADATANTISVITPDGAVALFAGAQGQAGAVAGIGAAARFSAPTRIFADASGNLYIADTGNHVIRTVAADGTVLIYAGTPNVSGTTDGYVTQARLNQPHGICADSAGNIYIADTGNSSIRKISTSGQMSTIAGTPGMAGLYDGVGQGALFDHPGDLVYDGSSAVYIVDTGNVALRKLTLSTGQVSTIVTAITSGTLNGGGGGNGNNNSGNGSSSGGGGGAPSLWCVLAMAGLLLGQAVRLRNVLIRN